MVSGVTRIRLHDEPRALENPRVLPDPLTVLLAAGIVNPFGPTLNVIAALGAYRPGARVPVAYLMLNPFNQSAEEVGEIELGPDGDLAGALPALFELDFGGCPSLLLPSTRLDVQAAVAVHARFLQRFPDARELLERVKQWLGDPEGRIAVELRGVTDLLRAWAAAGRTGGLGGGARAAQAAPLEPAEAEEMARLLLSPAHAEPELMAFLSAWTGAVELAPGMATMGPAPLALMLTRLAESCRIPRFSDA